MKISNGLKITAANKTLCCKLLFYKLVVLAICGLFIFLFANMIIQPIINSLELSNIIEIFKKIIVEFLGVSNVSNYNYSDELSNALKSLLVFISNMKGKILLSVILTFIIIQIIKFLLALCDYVTAININEHMTSMHHAEFFSTLIENFGGACKYAGFRTLMLLIYNVILLTLISIISIFMLEFLGVYAIVCIMLLIFSTMSIRLCLSSQVLPKIICEKQSVFTAFFKAFKEKEFGLNLERFISYFIMVVLSFIVFVLTAIVTFNISFLIIYPFTSVSFIAVKFVDYYTVIKKKYYINFDDIVVPKELRQNDEELLNKVDI